MFRRVLPAVLAMSFALVVSGALPASAASHSVGATNYRFTPATLTITVGDTVTWTNQTSDTPHTTTANGGAWDSGTLNPGQTFSHTFTTPGTFAYHCQFHQSLGMVGTIVVKAAGPSPTGATPPPAGSGAQGGSPLPNTGAGSSTIVLFWLGLGLLAAGAVTLFGLRRRA